MDRPLGRRGAAGGELGGEAPVDLRPRGGPGRLVDRRPHDRVAEAEAQRHVGGADQVAGDEVVDARRGGGLVDAGRGREQIAVEGLAGDGGGADEVGLLGGQGGELGGEGRRDRAGEAPARGPLPRRRRSAGRLAQQLVQVEGVAAAGGEQAIDAVGVDAPGDHPHGRLPRERPELHPGHRPVAPGRAERALDARHRLAGAGDEREQDRGPRRAADQVREQLERGGVGPVQVVEREQERLLGRQQLEQRADALVQAEALLRGGGRWGGLVRGERREGRAEVAEPGLAERGEAPGRLRGEVVVERRPERAEGQLALELGGLALQHQVAALGGVGAEPVQQPGLADAGLAGEQDGVGAAARGEPLQGRIQLRALALTPNQLLG